MAFKPSALRRCADVCGQRSRIRVSRLSRRLRLVLGLLLGLFLALPVQLRASTYYWDSNGATAGAGAAPSGTWGTSSFWTTSSAGTLSTSPYTTTSADSLYFAAGPGPSSAENAYVVTVVGNQYSNSLNFQSAGAPTFSGTGTIYLGSGGINVAQYAYGSTAQGAVLITPQVLLQGPLSWTNNSSNYFTTAGIIVNNGNLLTVAGLGNTIVNGAINGSGGLAQSGPGELILQCANSFTGATTVSGGTLNLSNAAALQASTLIAPTTGGLVFDQNVASRNYNIGALSGAGNLVLANNAATPAGVTLNVGGNSAVTTYSGILSGAGALVEVGGGMFTLSGASNTYSGGTTVTSGTAVFTNPGALPSYSTTAAKLTVGGSGALTANLGGSGWTAANVGNLLAANSGSFAAGATLGIDTTGASGTTTFSFNVAGNLGLAKLGPNTLSLTAANTFSGTAIVSGGTLNLANANALQGSTLVAPTFGGTLAFDPSIHAFALGGLSGQGNLSLQNGAAIALTVGANNANTVYAGGLSGAGSLAKVGSGTTVFIGNNTFLGGSTLTSGTLQVGDGSSGHDGVLPASGGVNDGTSLIFNLFGAETYAGVISGAGGMMKAGAGLLVLTNTNTYSAGTAISSGTLQLGTAAIGQDGMVAASGGIFNNGTLVYDLNGAQTYAGAISGSGLLVKNGAGMLALSGTSAYFLGTTSISAGTLTLSSGGALQGSTLVAPLTGRLVFDPSVTSRDFSLGALSGSGNIALQTSGPAPAAIALTVGGNNTSTAYAGNLTGSGTLTKNGIGTWTLTGSDACNGLSVAAGGVTLAGTGSLTTGSSGSLFVGSNSPAALVVQDGATLSVAGNFDLNYQNTLGNASTLTLTGGSLLVAGKTCIGEAAMRTGPDTTSAAFYQSGGTASLKGSVTVGDSGTATSRLDISGGSLSVAGGLFVGNQGNGVANIHGSGIVNVTGGLSIGADPTLATCGSVSLSSGSLAVNGNLTLGSGGGLGSFTRSGGALSVSGSLSVAGTAQLVLDGTVANVTTTFGGLAHAVGATLVVVPATGNLATSESLSFSSAPSLTNGILGPWAVLAASATDSSGDYLTTTGTGTKHLTLAIYSSGGFNGSSGTTVVAATSASTLANNTTAYAVKFGAVTTTLGSTASLAIASGGMIFNGGMLTGGTVSTNGITPLIYAGSPNPSRISSAIVSDAGLTKFGPGNLVLAGNNSGLHNNILVSAGTLEAESALALGASGSADPVTVAAGATLAIQGNVAIGNAQITLNGSGTGGAGALSNVEDNNSLAGAINLGSDSQINTTAGTLTLTGPVAGVYALTKTGSGTLVLAGNSGSGFPSITVAAGTLRVQNGSAVGSDTAGTTVNNGATLQLQGGVAIANVPLVLSGAGTGGNGSLENVQGNNSFSGTIRMAADSQVNVDAASDTLALSGTIGGGFALSKGGTGTLLLSGNNTFTGGLNVTAGTLVVPDVNAALTSGPLGAGGAAVSLGGSGTTATFVYTGSGTTSNRNFTLGAGTVAAGSGGVFQITSSLSLGSVIDGNGSLTKTGSGLLTLGGSNLYTGATTVSAGTLAIGPAGSINASGNVFVNQGAMLQITAGSGGSQMSNASNLTLGGGTLTYAANGSTSVGELVGTLALAPGQSQVVLTNTGSGTPYLCFASGTTHVPGATVEFSTSGAQVQFLANPPAMSGSILPYAFVGLVNSASVDFATLSTAGSTTLSALTYASTATGDINSSKFSGTTDVATTGSLGMTMTASRALNSLKLTGIPSLSMTGAETLTLNSGGLICTGNPATISGGTLSAPAGELIVNTATALSVASVISASSALTKTGTAALTLSCPNSSIGSIYINQGTLVYAPSSNSTYANAISGPGNLAMSGSGAMLTLSGSDTYTGNTTVTGGTLCINGSLAGGGPVTLQNGAVLSGTGSIAGNVSVNAGTLTVGQQGSGKCLSVGGGISVGGSGALVASGTSAAISGCLNYTSSASSTFSGTILGAASVVTLDSPAGTVLTLSGSNPYGGGTLLESGMLKPANSAALGSGCLTMTGGTLDLDSLPSLAITFPAGNTGGVITKSGSGATTLIVNTPADTNLSAMTDGTGVLALELSSASTGTLALYGTNTYTGGTTILGGTLDIMDAAALPSGTNLTVGNALAFGGVLPDYEAAPVSDFSQPAAEQVNAVPEPGTLGLVLAAAVGLCLARLRRRAR